VGERTRLKKEWIIQNYKTGDVFYELDVDKKVIETHFVTRVENMSIFYNCECFNGDCKCEKEITADELSWDSYYFTDKATAEINLAERCKVVSVTDTK